MNVIMLYICHTHFSLRARSAISVWYFPCNVVVVGWCACFRLRCDVCWLLLVWVVVVVVVVFAADAANAAANVERARSRFSAAAAAMPSFGFRGVREGGGLYCWAHVVVCGETRKACACAWPRTTQLECQATVPPLSLPQPFVSNEEASGVSTVHVFSLNVYMYILLWVVDSSGCAVSVVGTE